MVLGGWWRRRRRVRAGQRLLGYLADRRCSPATVRAYAFDLLVLCRWLVGEGVALADVSTEVLLRFLVFCRTTVLPGQAENVFSIRDGGNVGYAPATVNRRLAAVSALFAFRVMRDPEASSPVPRGKPARTTSSGERWGLAGPSGASEGALAAAVA
jgi:site-specific recombinase XerD